MSRALFLALTLSLAGAAGAATPALAAAPPLAAPTGPAYVGVHGQPIQEGDLEALEIIAIDPGSPAEKAGMQVGDRLFEIYVATGILFGPGVPITRQEHLDDALADKGANRLLVFVVRRAGKQKVFRFRATAPPEGLAQGAPAAAPGSAPKVLSPQEIEQARTAYFQMCGKGAERLSPETCDAMRRDLDAAVAAQAAVRREAEVMGVYRQLCTPSAPKLSADTCAAMLAEAKRQLAAPTPTPQAEAQPPEPPAAAPESAGEPAARRIQK